jgi:hypothetical protein
MNTEKIKLTQVSTNEKNPRRITDGNLKKLINSILVFPRMLELRPIVIDDAMIPLGGNMRIKALTHIAAMSIEQIKSQLQTVYDFTKKTKKQQQEIEKHWEEWDKTIHVVRAKILTEEEKQQFIIKDNVSFGEWNFDTLKNWDNDALNDWGLDIDLSTPIEAPGDTEQQTEEKTAESYIPKEALPEELQGIDITPQDLPKIQGDGETKNEYISISYTDDQADILAEMVGVAPEKLYSKIVWNINELLNLRTK